MKERNKEYMFVREDGFYFVDCADDDDALDCVFCNPGTIQIVDTASNKEIYSFTKITYKETEKC